MEFKNLFVVICLLMGGCASGDKAEGNIPDDTVTVVQPVQTEQVQPSLPFVGKRQFETRPGVSGTGTPGRWVEIRADGTVEFTFMQINQSDETETRGVYNAGPFQKIVKCVFKEWDNETRFYEITATRIYETDSNGVRLELEDCCLDATSVCPCQSDYFGE
ncbi:hypothetical protein [Polluticoccus soli]|uniref:hypothetical protein n=1 Tax=Polluticoccus soli TaxID=3034150 RepID=UPI0023E1328D|nr:hypothetical protein [Flavipsychrobacter sp. JY13-12]